MSHACSMPYLELRATILKGLAFAQQAKKEGNTEVCRKLEEVLRVAMEEKQKTLRPEIQLLNNLMAATTVPERERVCLHC